MTKFLINLIVSVCLLLPAATVAPPAQAVTININIGGTISNGRSISCSGGERLLRNRGFRDVRRIDCRGRFFIYRAWRGNRRFEIAIRASTGVIVDVRRIR